MLSALPNMRRVQQAAKNWDFAGDCKNKATYVVFFLSFFSGALQRLLAD